MKLLSHLLIFLLICQNVLAGACVSLEDTHNQAECNASGYGVTLGISTGTDSQGKDKTTPSLSVGLGSDQNSASSTTQANISGIAGNTEARTGDAETGIKPIFDKDRVRNEVGAQVEITGTFGQQATTAIGNYADSQVKQALAGERQAANSPDGLFEGKTAAEWAQESNNWGEGGTNRTLLHTLAGAAVGGMAGAAGAGLSQAAIPQLDETLRALGVDDATRQTVLAAAGTALGAAVGGSAGAAAAGNATVNNYLNHSQWDSYAGQLAECKGKSTGCSIQEETAIRGHWAEISTQQNAALANCAQTNNCAQLQAEVASGTNRMLELVGTDAIPGGAPNNDLGQFLGQQLASNPQRREEVSNALQAAAICNANPGQCTQQAMTATALVLAPLLGIAEGGVALGALVSAGRLTASEATLFIQLGPVNYCRMNPTGCLVIAETTAGVATNSAAPSALPTGPIKGAGGKPGVNGGVGSNVNVGPWSNGITNVVENGTFTQCGNGSCVSATAQVLTNGSVTEAQVVARIGEWADPLKLPGILNELAPGSTPWRGGYFGSSADAVTIANKGPMGAVLQAPGEAAHMVTISPIPGSAGMFRVQDTGVGKTYDVPASWIGMYVIGGVWK